ncbi:hypothetical protein C8F04DRAFT_1184619 [Mycena alexandri]|uniref:Uncharacterized protein n=1 Tax=Mycena alexandri TaxID=1745969 RepID=A0AAD6SS73_9AGAR|nr:hypothetical protein C8F04DRAFT_1184619 [Mycena alexandri]
MTHLFPHCLCSLLRPAWQWSLPVPFQHSPGARLRYRGWVEMSAAGSPLFIIVPGGRRLARQCHTDSTDLSPTVLALVLLLLPRTRSPTSYPLLYGRFQQMPNQRHTDPEYPDLYPADPRLWGEENSALITTLNEFHLIFEFLVPAPPNGVDIKEHIFYADLNATLTEFMNKHHLSFSGVPATAPTPPMPATVLNEWHALRLLHYPRTTVNLGNKPKAGFRRKLTAAVTPWYDFKIAALRTKTSWSAFPDFVNPNNVLYLIASKYGPVRGPVPPNFLLDATHLCLPLHLQHALRDFDDATIECHPDCSTVVTPAPAHPAAGATTSEQSLLLDIPLDADQEDKHLRLALANSLGETPGPSLMSSTPEAGPSRRPLPTPPLASI